MIALGSDTFSEGKISYGLADELCRVLEKFTETMKLYRVKDYRAYATTAMREAKTAALSWTRYGCVPDWRYTLSATLSSVLSVIRQLRQKQVSSTRSSRKVLLL